MLPDSYGLYTDYYEHTMACGFFLLQKHGEHAVFDYFFRTNPFENGFTVFAGLYDLLEMIGKFRFSASDTDFLRQKGFPDSYLDWLSGFRFEGTISSVNEGEIIFPNEPVLRVEGRLAEAQLIETLLLNVINFQSLVATKAYRIRQAAGDRIFAEFGLRRAQGSGGIMASRAAVIGGADSTSNVLAASYYDMPVSGTQAHSWIQSFDSEYEAFSAYAQIYGSKTILLVDTYNTLRSGIPNAIKVAHEMEQRGEKLWGIRLDSGDLAYLSKKARQMLDSEGLSDVKIVISNQLDEYVIKSLLTEQEAPIDAIGVGTGLSVGKPDAALDGVYKLCSGKGIPRMKLSENIEKVTLPGVKKLLRFFDKQGYFYRDGIFLRDEPVNEDSILFNPLFPEKNTPVGGLFAEELMQPVLEGGKILIPRLKPSEIHNYLRSRIACLPVEHLRFIRPHVYKVGISEKLLDLRTKLINESRKE